MNPTIDEPQPVPDVPELPPVPEPSRVGDAVVFSGVTYARPLGFRPLLMDVHVPARAPGPVPCVVWVHGGAWWEGDRRYPPGNWPGEDGWFRSFVADKMAVATVDYRLSGEAPYPAQLADVQAAIRFLRHHAERFALDADRMGVSGESAGGHLAAMVALTGDAPVEPTHRSITGPSSAVQAAVPLYPVTGVLPSDFPPADAVAGQGPSPEEWLLGDRAGDSAATAAASPVNHAHRGAPPMLLIHGDADSLVPVEHSVLLARALEEAGVDVRLEVVPGAEHCFEGVDPGPPLRAAVAFLAERLGA